MRVWLFFCGWFVRFVFVFEVEVEEAQGGEGEGGEAGELGALEAPEERAVVAPEVFEEEAQKGVEHDVEAEDGAFRMAEAGEPQEQDKDEDVALALPYFRRPEGLRAVGAEGERGVGIEKAEVSARGMAEGVAVHEVGNAAHGLPEDDGRGDRVREGEHRDAVPPQIDLGGGEGEEEPALDSHAALPDEEELRQVVVIVVPVEEEDVPQTAAENAGEGDGESQVEDVRFPAASVFFQEKIGGDASGENAQREENAVEADREVADEGEVLVHGSRR